MLQTVPQILTALIFPPECEICHTPLSHEADGVCERCDRSLRTIPAPHCPGCGRTIATEAARCSECAGVSFHFDRAYATALYHGGMKEILHRYKFNGHKYLRKYLVRRLLNFHQRFLTGHAFDGILAIPLDTSRQKERGFNQSLLLSKPIARSLGLPELSADLSRKRPTAPQHRLSKEMRSENIAGCFSADRDFTGRKLLLIDDILTTGITVSECAGALKDAGAVSVTVLACARGL